MTRVLLTGATGFIGKRITAPLQARGFEVHTLGRAAPTDASCVHHQADLLDPCATRVAVAAAQASHLVHLAWYVEPGMFWRSARNIDWVAASLNLIRCFADEGGSRFVAAGSCSEYSWGSERLCEDTSPCEPASLYGSCKDALRRILTAFARTLSLSCAWGRVFFLYGPGEAPGKLVGDATRSLLLGQAFETTHGRQRRDFVHVDDAAGAFAALAAADVEGAVNIASGTAVAVRDLLVAVARETGRADLLKFGARPLAASEPSVIEGCVRRLHDEVGYQPRYDIRSGITSSVAWWRAQDIQPTGG